MTLPIEKVYFTWLCDRVNIGFGKPSGKTYVDLLGQLHTKEFVWVVPNDDNRLEDAMGLRYHFLNETGITKDDGLTNGIPPFSVLEVIVSLSERCAFAGEGYPPDWAWQLIENLELHKMSDPVSPRQQEEIDAVLENLIWRNYDPDGTGGFFPLSHPETNQTKIEIWYQMNAYIDEQLTLEH